MLPFVRKEIPAFDTQPNPHCPADSSLLSKLALFRQNECEPFTLLRSFAKPPASTPLALRRGEFRPPANSAPAPHGPIPGPLPAPSVLLRACPRPPLCEGNPPSVHKFICVSTFALQNVRVMIEVPRGPAFSEPAPIPDGVPFPSFMSSTVFLGNLPTWVTADDIKAWLVAENLVADSVKVIRNPETQESKGFAFIEAPNEEEMHLIIKRFDRAPLEDRLLRANPAQPPRSRAGGAPAPVQRREGQHFSAPPRPAASSGPAGAASSAAPTSAPMERERSRRGGKKHARKAQGPQTLFAEELAKAL